MSALAPVLGAPPAQAGDFGRAIEFIFDERTNREGVEVGGAQVLELTLTHLRISAVAMAVAVAVAVPLGLWLGHLGRGQVLATSVANVGRAVPSLALIALFVAFLGIGDLNVTLALVLLAIPPILTNTYVGVRQADRDAVDAARGQGMSGAQIVRGVELPLALPLVFGGIRTSAVNVIATATIAPLGGVLTLGDPIINPTAYGDDGRLAASIVVAALAVAAEVLLAGAQRAATPKGLRLRPGHDAVGRRGPLTIPTRRARTTP